MSSFLSRPFRHILGGRATEPETSQDFLKVLVNPPQASVDVVAVHGLNPFGKTNHAEATWSGGKNDIWLKDWLPIGAPQARVLLFGYNSNAAFSTIKLGLRGQAINLLDRLAAERKACPDRPLVFICHSLGGLVVKQALISATGAKVYQGIPASTYGIAFFGTPHRGGNLAGIGAFAAEIARAVLGNPGNGLVRALKKNSDVLDGITEDFRPFLENFQFLSFFETKNFGSTRNLVVTKESATLGLTPDREKQLGLPADHSGICRFDSKDNDTYKQVEQNIVDMITAAAAAPKTRNVSNANAAQTNGIQNETFQAGTANRSMTNGDGNRTTQMGQGNSSETQGSGNTTRQVSMTAEEVKAHTEKMLNSFWK